MTARRVLLLAALTAPLLFGAACGSTSRQSTEEPVAAQATEITLMVHDSFDVSQSVLDRFRDETAITVKVLKSGDAGAALNQAILTKDHPVADVLYGVDNTYMGRALESGIYDEYQPHDLAEVPEQFQIDPTHHATPVDFGDVCVNVDDSWFAAKGVPKPASLDDLVDPRYKDLMVVQNPATSSPGLAFLLATIAERGDAGWQAYWSDLKANGVAVTDGWEDAYFGRFTAGGGGGDRPIVVSYATSPPATVVLADPPIDAPTTSAITSTCFRQVETVGVLKGTAHPDAARRVVDLMLSEDFQADMPLRMFVYPVREGVALPEVFTKWAEPVSDPHTMSPEEIQQNRETWIDQWKSLVLG